MKASPKPLAILLLFGLLAAWTAPLAAQTTAASQIKSEIARLQQSLKDTQISDPNFKELPATIGDVLKSADATVNAGHFYLALEKLGQAEDYWQGVHAVSNTAEVEKNGMPAFEAQWGKASLRLTALDKDAHAHDWKGSALAVRALAEAAQGKAIPLLEGGRGFATANGPKDGLFYVGRG